jgi:hypothetical protein
MHRRIWSALLKSPLVNRAARSWHLGKLAPVSRTFGYDRGSQSVARYYIDSFIDEHASDIRGRVLELGDATYTRRFGAGRVTRGDVVSLIAGPDVTIVADLTKPNALLSDSYDCVILTQGLQAIYDFRAAIQCVSRILAPGGVVLATMSGISQISRYDMDQWGEYWRFTTAAANRAFGESFPRDQVTARSYGNVASAASFLYGLASSELNRADLDRVDPDYQVIVAARAVKPMAGVG